MKRFARLMIPGILLLTSCDNPATSDPAAARTAPDLELSFTLQDGLNGYAGTIDTSTYKVAPIGNPHPGTFSQLYAQAQANAMTGRNAFLRFDLEGVKTQIATAMGRLGDSFSITDCSSQLIVNDAIVSLFSMSDIGSISTSFSMTALMPTAPLFSEDDSTTWTQANATDAWNITAAGGGVDSFTDQYLGYNTYRDLPSSSFGQWVDFRLFAAHVQAWLCDQTTNKGVLLTLVGGGSSGFKFFSRETVDRSFRPIMQLKIQVYATAGSR